MKLISWNCRGFGAALTIKELKVNCNKFKPQMVFLMETKQSKKKFECVRRRRFNFFGSYYVDPRGLSGGLAVWWHEDLKVEILFSSKNFIHTVTIEGQIQNACLVTFVYGPPNVSDRDVFWKKLHELAPSMDMVWLCVGDFIEILYQSEKWGGNFRNPRSFSLFQDWTAECDMVDLDFKGQKFTWSNGQLGGGLIKERLDRAMANISFRLEFIRALVFHVETIESNHCLLVVGFNFVDRRMPWKFRFESMWVEHDEYHSVVRDGWSLVDELEVYDKIHEVEARLNSCRALLSQWSKNAFPNNKKEIERLMGELSLIKNGDMTIDKANEVGRLKGEVEKLWELEEKYWGQGIRWSELGIMMVFG